MIFHINQCHVTVLGTSRTQKNTGRLYFLTKKHCAANVPDKETVRYISIEMCNLKLQEELFRKTLNISANAGGWVTSLRNMPASLTGSHLGNYHRDGTGRQKEDKKKDTFIQDILFNSIYPPSADVSFFNPVSMSRWVILT